MFAARLLNGIASRPASHHPLLFHLALNVCIAFLLS